jgi:hypothetical protein
MEMETGNLTAMSNKVNWINDIMVKFANGSLDATGPQTACTLRPGLDRKERGNTIYAVPRSQPLPDVYECIQPGQ